MKKYTFILFLLLSGIFTGFSQSYVVFDQKPRMQLVPKSQYNHCQVKFRATERSTIYLELKKADAIVASGIYEVRGPSSEVVRIPLNVQNTNQLTPGSNYSYNLYMYHGAPNDWTKKACRSAHIPRVQMQRATAKKENSAMSNSLRNFFK